MVKLRKCEIPFLFFILIYSYSFAGIRDEILFIEEVNSSTKQEEGVENQSDFEEASEIKLLFLGAIKFYQTFISSQDMPVCNFTPSCSHFGLEAIKKCGILKGLLMTSDRLQRCNGFTRNLYKIDVKTGKAIDPVESYIFKKEK